jgi:hypothetical protein
MAIRWRSNWRNRNLSHPMSPRWGGSFSLGRLGPKEMSSVTWSFEEAKVKRTKVKFPLHRSPPKQIVLAKQPIITQFVF